MKVRGQRKCGECGHRWSYYDTGSVSCPACGTLKSVAAEEERQLHTDAAVEFDLSSHRRVVGEETLAAATDGLKSDLRAYVRKRGFVSGGNLRPLDETYLSAHELLHAADVYARRLDPTDDDREYVLSLLRGADAGERPGADEVPGSMTAARGLAAAGAVEAYRRDVSAWLDDRGTSDSEARGVATSLRDRVKRVEALQGDVSVRESDALVAAARDFGTYLREDDPNALVAAEERLAGD